MTGALQLLAGLLGELGEAEARILEEAVHTRRYAPGHAISREGQQARHFFLLLQGRVRLSRSRPDGGQAAIAYVNPVALFGHVAVIGREPALTTATAWEAVECLLIPASLLVDEADGAHGRLAIRLREAALRGLNQQLRAANARLLSMASTDDVIADVAAALGSWTLPSSS